MDEPPAMNQKKKTDAEKKNDRKEKNKRLDDYKLNSDLVKAGNLRIQDIVLSMIDNAVNPQRFIKQVRYLNQDGYEDIIEERSITSLCGYPMCWNKFTDKYGNRSYIIRSNRVYDITKRRKFCSNLCFSLSEYVGNQVSNTPLYLRDAEEVEIRDVILPKPESIKSRHGHLIDVTGGLLDLEDDLIITKQMAEQREVKAAADTKSKAFSSFNDVAIDSLIQCSENKENEDTNDTDDSKKAKSSIKNKLDSKSDQIKTVRFNDTKDSTSNKDKLKANINELNSNLEKERSFVDEVSERLSDIQINNDNNEASIGNEKISKPESQCNENSKTPFTSVCQEEYKSNILGPLKVDVGAAETGSKTLECSEKQISLENVYQVEKYLCEWMTFESLRTILGDKYVRGMLEHLGHSWEDYDTTQGLRLGIEAKSKYLTLCRKLDREEREEEAALDIDIDLPEENTNKTRPSGPLPDYQKLAMDTKQRGHKVVAFLQGKDCFTDEKEEEEETIEESEWPDANKLGTITEETESGNTTQNKEVKSDNKKKRKVKAAAESLEPDVRLPHVDSYSQNTWRRQIVMEKLGKIIGELSDSLSLLEGELRNLVTELIATFDLTPHNIMLKPGQWTLVALVLLQMLSVRYKVIETAMQTSNGHMLIKLILEGYGLDRDYLLRLLSYLTQINYILTKYHKKPKQYCGECQTESGKNTNESTIVKSDKMPNSVTQIEKESLVTAKISTDDIQSMDSQYGKLNNTDEPVGTNAEELD